MNGTKYKNNVTFTTKQRKPEKRPMLPIEMTTLLLENIYIYICYVGKLFT